MLAQYGDRNMYTCLYARVLCDEMKEQTADILIPHEKAITRVFWFQQRLVGDVPFYLKFVLKLTHHLSIKADIDRFPRITSQLHQLAQTVRLN